MQQARSSLYVQQVLKYLSDEFPDGPPLGWLTVMAKNQQRMALAEWLDAATEQGKRRNSWLNVVWHHRPRKASPADAYVTMSGATFKQLLTVLQMVYDETEVLEQLVKRLEQS